MTSRTETGSLLSTIRQSDLHQGWLTYLEQLEVPVGSIELPPDDDLARILAALEVPEADIGDVIASRPSRECSPDTWWLIERSVAALTGSMGDLEGPPRFPSPREIAGINPWYFVYIFVATLPHTRAYHASRGIPDDIAAATLADLGRNVRVNHKRYGEGGLEVAFWLALHARGVIYQLGRLQFERARLGASLAQAMIERGEPASPDEVVLSVHIPDFLGPFTPDRVDASIAEARGFFRHHFPEDRIRYAVCHSWLLDPQLKEYLAPASNIVQFQDRFALSDRKQDADRSIVQFVFGPAPDDLRELPQRTSLERAVAGHLLAGRHWHGRSGWFRWG